MLAQLPQRGIRPPVRARCASRHLAHVLPNYSPPGGPRPAEELPARHFTQAHARLLPPTHTNWQPIICVLPLGRLKGSICCPSQQLPGQPASIESLAKPSSGPVPGRFCPVPGQPACPRVSWLCRIPGAGVSGRSPGARARQPAPHAALRDSRRDQTAVRSGASPRRRAFVPAASLVVSARTHQERTNPCAIRSSRTRKP